MKNIMAEGFFESAFSDAGRKLDWAVDKAESIKNETLKELSNLKKEVKAGVESALDKTKSSLNNLANRARNMMHQGKEALVRSYRNVSESTKKTVENITSRGQQLLKQGKEYTEAKINDLANGAKMVAEAVKNGTLNSIKYAKETGRMIVVIAGKSFEYAVNTGKNQINQLKNLIKEKTIQTVTFLKNTGEIAIKLPGKMLKYTLQTAIAAWLVLYRGGKIVLNESALAVKKAVGKTQEIANHVGKKIDQGIREGRSAVASGLHNAANAVAPQPMYAKVEK